MLEAIRDVLPELPVSVGLVEWTDSLGFKMQHDQLAGGHVKQRRRTRQPDTGTLYAVRREAGVRLERVEWLRWILASCRRSRSWHSSSTTESQPTGRLKELVAHSGRQVN